MLRTPLCDLLGIDVPVIQASLGPWTSVELTAAVSNAGAMGSLGTALRSPERIRTEIEQARVDAASEDAVKVEFANAVFPPPGEGGYDTLPHVLRTSFVDDWNTRAGDVPREAERLRTELMNVLAAGRAHELVPFSGQSAGLIREILPAAEILRRLVAEAEAALASAM
jgi:enoyl-[acyl-carrier protein] reductase II